jgi:GGDEF domain-containing protein
MAPGYLDGAPERADQAMYNAKQQGGGSTYGP